MISDVLALESLQDTEDLRTYLDNGIRAVQTTPLMSRGGRLLGMLSTHWTAPHTCNERELRALDILVRQAADLIDRHHQEEALRAADRKKDVFLMTLAHELRNPLAAVRSAVEFLKRRALSDPDVGRARDIIHRQAAVMARLLDDLLDVGRITRDRLELRAEPVELGGVLRSAVEASAALVEDCQHGLEISTPEIPIYVLGDEVRLSQVFVNLLNNACRYTERNGRVTVTLDREGSEAVVAIGDSGIGIQMDRLSGIFDMFSQIDSSLGRSRGGLGIGLHLVKRLVEMHSGRVEARSEGPGLGSTFIVRVPLLEVPEVTEPPHVSVATPVTDRRRRVLIVDDNVDAAEMLSTLLELSDHQTVMAHDGERALSLAGSFRPDTVLLDIGLPQLNGYDVCRQLRAQPWGKDMTVVAVTGWGQEADRVRSREAGFDHHLVKPIEHDALLGLLASLPVPSSSA